MPELGIEPRVLSLRVIRVTIAPFGLGLVLV